MALYKHGNFLTQTDNAAFDARHSPGATAPYSGIYRCVVCGHEITSEESNPLPPQNHHQHAPGLGPIAWRLIVYADHKPK